MALTDGSGLCYGGDLAHAAQLVREGAGKASLSPLTSCRATSSKFCHLLLTSLAVRKEAFTFFKGRVDWQPRELKGEVEAGEWKVAAPRGEGATEGGAEAGSGFTATQLLPSALPAAAADDAESRRRERYATWSKSVGAVAAAEEADDGPEARSALRSWLQLRPLEASDAAEISAAGGAAAAVWPFTPPPWREGED